MKKDLAIFNHSNVRIERSAEWNLVVKSRVIAEQLGKRHDNVIRDLEQILETSDSSSLIISSFYEVEGQNRKYKEYLLTEKGFTLYMFNIQGYNEVKMAYINEFERMKDALNNPLSMLLSMNKESLALTCIQLTQQVQEKDEIIISQTPKVEYHDNVLKSNGLLTMTMVAKDMSMSAKTLNAMLNVLGLIYKQSQTWYLYSEYEHLLEDGYFDYHISEHGQLLKATELGRKLIMKSIELKSVKLALKEMVI